IDLSFLSFDGETIVVDGEKALAAAQGEVIRLRVSLLINGEDTEAYEEWDIWLRETEETYKRAEGRIMHLNETEYVDISGQGYIRNTDHPDGDDFEYEVTGVRVLEQSADDEEPVLEIRNWYRWDDPEEDQIGWEYTAKNPGEATVEVAYKDFYGNPQTYTFRVRVIGYYYDLELRTKDGFRSYLPGGQATLLADLACRTLEGQEGSLDGLEVQWEATAGSEYVSNLTTAGEHQEQATLTFTPLAEEEDNIYIEFKAKLYETGKEDLLAENWISVHLEKSFYRLNASSVDPDMHTGLSTPVTVEVRHYEESDPAGTPVENAKFYWSFDTDEVQILDQAGSPVGYINEADWNQYVGTTAAGTYTFRRLGHHGSSVSLHAEWENEWGTEGADASFPLEYKEYELELTGEQDSFYNERDTLARTLVLRGFEGLTPEDYAVELTCGKRNYDGTWEITIDPADYSFDGTEFRLTGENAWAAFGREDNVDVYIAAKIGDVIRAELFSDFYLEEAEENYFPYGGKEEDRKEHTGMTGFIAKTHTGWIEDAAHQSDGYGESFEYDYESVTIVSQTPETAGQEVVRLTPVADADRTGWEWETLAAGTAELEVRWTGVYGDEMSYTFKIRVSDYSYDIGLETAEGRDKSLPGQPLTFVAKAQRWLYIGGNAYERQEELGDVTYRWSVPEESESIITLTPDSQDPTRATAVGQLPEDQSVQWATVQVDLLVGDEVVASTYKNFQITQSYMALEIDGWNPDLPVGGEGTFTCTLTQYESVNGEIVTSPAANVRYNLFYDQEGLEIRDPNGVYIGEDDGGNISEAFINPCTFTIRRSGDWSQTVQVYAYYEGLDDWEENEYTRLDLNEIGAPEYHVRFTPEEQQRVYNDGQITYLLSTEGLDTLDPANYDVQLTIGQLDRNGWRLLFTEGNEYTYDPATGNIVINGANAWVSGATFINLEARLLVDGQEADVAYGNCELREARVDMEREWDREMLPHWGGRINGTGNGWEENTANPDGKDFTYTVADVEIISSEPEEAGQPVVEITKQQGDDLLDFWYDYEALNKGTCVIRVTAKDEEYTDRSYEFRIEVKDDVYSVRLNTEDGADTFLPAGTARLITEAWHESIDPDAQGDFSGISYVWLVEEGEDYIALTPSADGRTCDAAFSLPEGQEEGEICVAVELKRSGETVARDEMRLWVAQDFFELYPLELDRNMHLGKTQKVTAEMKRFDVEHPQGVPVE
ncbi:MAG: hypothetical protein IJM69_03285, partial [Firmicutes bacterium]|nr:hypothetical protein [Bacillota bacterium]